MTWTKLQSYFKFSGHQDIRCLKNWTVIPKVLYACTKQVWGMDQVHKLDEALAFAAWRLESLVVSQSCPDHLREYNGNALKFPHHKGMQRVEARLYKSSYQKHESRNNILLKFAKYDFNRVQMLHQKELSPIQRYIKFFENTHSTLFRTN